MERAFPLEIFRKKKGIPSEVFLFSHRFFQTNGKRPLCTNKCVHSVAQSSLSVAEVPVPIPEQKQQVGTATRRLSFKGHRRYI